MEQKGLYHSSFERDSCGIGFIVNIKGIKSHQIVSDALTILENMEHRGGCGCEDNTGDGAGITIQVPHEFLYNECIKLGLYLPDYGQYGVGMLFLSQDEQTRKECRDIFLRTTQKLGLHVIGFRQVPINKKNIGSTALSVEPYIEQVFIKYADNDIEPDILERKLFILRNYVTHIIHDTVKNGKNFYITSLSYKTIIYKGQLKSSQLRTYYVDLSNKEVVSALGLIHSRFATNTFPSWQLAQPFRYIGHNGEINTIQGNKNWLKSSEKSYTTPYFTKEEMNMIFPLGDDGMSDSAYVDNMIELLYLCGRSLPQVMSILIPEAWDHNPEMEPWKKAYYEYYACLMEPWDGPASICFTDGKIVGATLDRNGLRPSRFCITNDNRVIMASEAGVLPIDPSIIIENGRLQPGKMFIVDINQGRIISDKELKQSICSKQPYQDWLSQYKIKLNLLPEPKLIFTDINPSNITTYHKAFGYTQEDIQDIILPMCLDGKEPVGAMGLDTPLAILSHHPQHLSSYFKQLFAQVTNPPIDPIREKMVMSLLTFLGGRSNILDESPTACHCLELYQPIINNKELEKIRSIDTGILQAKTLQMYFVAKNTPNTLQKSLERICRYAVDAIEDGFELLILSDRYIDSEHAPIPSLLAVSAIHQHLVKKGLRGRVGLVVETGDAWEVHHFACLLAFGATVINPYLALTTIENVRYTHKVVIDIPTQELQKKYIKAICDGLLKVFSKMGISTVQSYRTSQLFEIVGIEKKVVDNYFKDTVSRIGGLSLDDIAKEALEKHYHAFLKQSLLLPLPVGGVYQWMRKGERHLFDPQSIHLLQYATRMNDYNTYKKYSRYINDQSKKAVTIRSLLEFKKNRPSVSIEEVEPIQTILKRFATGAMSFGSISHEAHSTLAIAMNRIGGKSNTGEGGEDPIRYNPLPNGDSMRSAIKQVASARFGVTSLYLTEANELQIKMAQGAKPGEGGQLPGHKVDEWIAKVRHSTPGVGLISPPPHHDIYSIEDLAQLIYDLKNANRHARISVKLVSKAGVGTIASGVAKAKADVILISGCDGGTGASPISSIRHAGLPWELGLAETHQTLVLNQLRNRIVLQTDGQMKTARDIAIATLLGAEEWGVATAALIVEGCIMMRKCHLNTCPVGVATQDPDLRKQFTGTVDAVVNFFHFLAQELREIMADLGFKTITEMVGQTDCLIQKKNTSHWKYNNINLSAILYKQPNSSTLPLYNSTQQDHGLDQVIDWEMLKVAQPALKEKKKVSHTFIIHNTNRTVGTILSHEITKIYKNEGLPIDTIHFTFKGVAGQSFAAFTTKGLFFEIEGIANDYFGKGLSGSKLVIYPPKEANFKAEDNIIIGNVAFYGATSGKAYIRGKAGERFCVRNSGLEAIVEGIGDHGCEYMTGGTVIILGEVGRNFAAGMSGGIAFIYNLNKDSFIKNCNIEMIDIEQASKTDEQYIKEMIETHYQLTKSKIANKILYNWQEQWQYFIKIFPKDYKKALEKKKITHNSQVHS